MTGDDELVGLDPYDLLDSEAERIDAFYSGLAGEQWSTPSACAGWSVRDVLCHLASSELYHRACLEGRVAAFFEEGAARGLSDLDGWNEAGVRAYDGRGEAEVLDEWRTSNAKTRRRFRECDGVEIDSSIGAYPARLQAFHVAQELATHADDVMVPIADAERTSRRSWRACVSRFALRELKPELRIEVAGEFTMVTAAAASVTLDEDDLIAAVAGRLRPGGRVDAATRALLSTMP